MHIGHRLKRVNCTIGIALFDQRWVLRNSTRGGALRNSTRGGHAPHFCRLAMDKLHHFLSSELLHYTPISWHCAICTRTVSEWAHKKWKKSGTDSPVRCDMYICGCRRLYCIKFSVVFKVTHVWKFSTLPPLPLFYLYHWHVGVEKARRLWSFVCKLTF